MARKRAASEPTLQVESTRHRDKRKNISSLFPKRPPAVAHGSAPARRSSSGAHPYPAATRKSALDEGVAPAVPPATDCFAGGPRLVRRMAEKLALDGPGSQVERGEVGPGLLGLRREHGGPSEPD